MSSADRPQSDIIDYLNFAGSRIGVIRDATVRKTLSPKDAVEELRVALRKPGRKESLPRIRLDSDGKHAWMHTLRARLDDVMGGKDYTSLGFETPALWNTVVDAKTGLPIAIIEANYLSCVRTAAVTALATDLMAPRSPRCLAHFGAGKISRLLVELIREVRPTIREVRLVRGDRSKGLPEWTKNLGCDVRLVSAAWALREASIITTATSSRDPVIRNWVPATRRKIHVNLVGSNHLRRAEIDEGLARRCLDSLLVADDPAQAAREAGDFAPLVEDGSIEWDRIPSLDKLLRSPSLRRRATTQKLTAFKSVGTGLMDLILAAAVVRRLGLLSPTPSFDERICRSMDVNATLTAFVQGSHRVTFSDMEAAVGCAASWLRAHGFQRGDRVAVLTLNRIETVAMEWATYRLGGTWIGIPSRAGEQTRIKEILNDFTPGFFIYETKAVEDEEEVLVAAEEAGYADRLDPPAIFHRRRYVALCPGSSVRIAPSDRFAVAGERIVRIRYSSGASGDPKAVAYSAATSRSIVSNIQEVILKPLVGKRPERTVVVHGAPITWATGSLIVPSFLDGGTNIFLERWRVEEFVSVMAEQKRAAVLTFLTPRLIAEVTGFIKENGNRWVPRRLVVILAGGPLPVSTAKQAIDAFPSGAKFFASLGMTEASFPITWHQVSEADCHPLNKRDWFVPLGPVTAPYAGSTVRNNELCLRGRAVALAKWVEGEWESLGQPYRTGDLVEGRPNTSLHYRGRSHDRQFVTKRRRPAPEAIEAVIDEHPGVVRSRLSYSFEAGRVVSTITVQCRGAGPDERSLREHFDASRARRPGDPPTRREEANLEPFRLDRIRYARVPLTMSAKILRSERTPEGRAPRRDGGQEPRVSGAAHASWKSFDFSQLARFPLYFYVGAGLSQAAGLVGWQEMADLVRVYLNDYEKTGTFRRRVKGPKNIEPMLDDFVRGLASSPKTDRLGRTALLNIMLRYRAPRYGLFDSATREGSAERGRPGLQPDPEDMVRQSLIWKSGCHGVFTTNYDMVLENAFSVFHHGSALRSYRYDARFLPYLLSNRQFVLKLHGDINDIQSMKFSPSMAWEGGGFRQTICDNLQKAYEAALQRGHMVYVGCGFSDTTIRKLNAVDSVAPAEDLLRIALVPSEAPELDRWRKQFPFITFRTFEQRAEVIEFLKAVTDARGDIDRRWHPCLEASDIHQQIFRPTSPRVRLARRMSTKEWACTVQ